MVKEYEIEFVVDGKKLGSSFISVDGGKLQTESAEDEFYATIRKNEAMWLAEAEDEEKTNLVDSLSKEQEDKLKEAHMKDYRGTDDDAPDAYEYWLTDLSAAELKAILK